MKEDPVKIQTTFITSGLLMLSYFVSIHSVLVHKVLSRSCTLASALGFWFVSNRAEFYSEFRSFEIYKKSALILLLLQKISIALHSIIICYWK